MDSPNYSLSDLAAAVKDKDCGANWNNPMWLLWALLFGGGNGLGFNRGAGVGQSIQDAEIMSQLNSLRELVTDNQNTNAIGAAVGSNHEALHALANQLGLGLAGTASKINDASMTNIMGQKDAQAQMSQCCCDIKSSFLTALNQLQAQVGANHAADQLQACQSKGEVLGRVDKLANGIEQGFASIGYAMAKDHGEAMNVAEKNTNAILQGQSAQTQILLNALNGHWTDELRQRYADAKLELSQKNQNAELIAALKTT